MSVTPLRRAEEGFSSTSRKIDPLIPTVFHEPWWLEAATGGQVEEVTVESGGRTVGRLPFVRKKHLGLVSCVLPELTPFLGPAVDEGTGGTVSRTLRRHQVTRDLIEKLPPFSNYYQLLHRGIPDALPFLQHGFSVEPHFTFEVAPAPEAAIWRNMRDKARNVIRRAEEQTRLVELEPEAFLRFYEANLETRGRFHNYLFGPNALKVFDAVLSRGRGRLIGAQDASGADLAAIFYAWDDAVSTYMLATRTPASHNGVVSRLVWEAMRDSAARGLTFDFGGVGLQGNTVLFYTAFGGEVRPRYVVHRSSPVYQSLRFSLAQGRGVLRQVRRLKPSRG